MLKILVIGDTHYKPNTLKRSQVMIDRIEEKIKELKPELIIMLGDLEDKFSMLNAPVSSLITNFLTMLRSYAPSIILIGNHSRISNDVFCTDEHSYNMVKLWISDPHPITIVDYPVNHKYKNIQFTFCPYCPDGRFIEALNLAPGWQNSRIIFCHQDFLGAKYNSQISTTGDDVSSITNLPMIISGHIHDFQEIKIRGDVKIIYTGSPMQHAFSENPVKSLSLVHVSSTSFEHERIMLDVPIFWTFKIHFKDVASYKPPQLPTHSDMKLVIEGTFAELKNMHKTKKISEWRQAGIRIQPSIIADKTKQVQPLDMDIINRVSFMTQLKEHLIEEHREMIKKNIEKML